MLIAKVPSRCEVLGKQVSVFGVAKRRIKIPSEVAAEELGVCDWHALLREAYTVCAVHSLQQ